MAKALFRFRNHVSTTLPEWPSNGCTKLRRSCRGWPCKRFNDYIRGQHDIVVLNIKHEVETVHSSKVYALLNPDTKSNEIWISHETRSRKSAVPQ